MKVDDSVTQLTLLCLRGRFDPAALDAARELTRARDLDWDAWYEATRAEALTPLLYRVLHGQGIIPDAIDEKLQVDYYLGVRRNALIFRELGRVLRILAAQQIAVILLKGAALAEAVCGNIAVRPMGDLDLLVRRDDVAAALAALHAAGWEAVETETRDGLALAYEVEIALQKPGPIPVMLEIRWSLLDSPHYQRVLPMAWFWETAVPVNADGASALALGPEALVLHLCAHLALHHRGEGLLWLHDVAEVAHAYGDRLDWESVLERAQVWDLVLPVQQVPGRVALDWQAPIPAGILQRLLALRPSADETRVHAWLTAAERPVAQRFHADLASMSSWRERVRYGWGGVFPSIEYMRVHAPAVRHHPAVAAPALLSLSLVAGPGRRAQIDW